MSLLVSTVSMVMVFNVSIYLPVIEDHMGKSLGLLLHYLDIIVFAKVDSLF